MKEVDFVEIKVRKVFVHPLDDYFRFHRLEADPAVIRESQEIIPDIIKEENSKIERVVNDGVESYFSVDREVWERLCLFENPVTVKSLIEERDSHAKKSIKWQTKAHYSEGELNVLKSSLTNVSLWKRIKLVFAGDNLLNNL